VQRTAAQLAGGLVLDRGRQVCPARMGGRGLLGWAAGWKPSPRPCVFWPHHTTPSRSLTQPALFSHHVHSSFARCPNPTPTHRYEKARKLKEHIGSIRTTYMRNWESRDRRERQVRGRQTLPCMLSARPQAAADLYCIRTGQLPQSPLPMRGTNPWHASPLSCLHPACADGHGAVLHRQTGAACRAREGRRRG
jgi:hypothetical protein